jgi:hypothetical protein
LLEDRSVLPAHHHQQHLFQKPNSHSCHSATVSRSARSSDPKRAERPSRRATAGSLRAPCRPPSKLARPGTGVRRHVRACWLSAVGRGRTPAPLAPRSVRFRGVPIDRSVEVDGVAGVGQVAQPVRGAPVEDSG